MRGLPVHLEAPAKHFDPRTLEDDAKGAGFPCKVSQAAKSYNLKITPEDREQQNAVKAFCLGWLACYNNEQ